MGGVYVFLSVLRRARQLLLACEWMLFRFLFLVLFSGRTINPVMCKSYAPCICCLCYDMHRHIPQQKTAASRSWLRTCIIRATSCHQIAHVFFVEEKAGGGVEGGEVYPTTFRFPHHFSFAIVVTDICQCA